MNDDLQSFIEPELEARIVALVLGEASAFEAGALEKLIAEQPELQAFKTRVAAVHGVVGLAHREMETEDWQLSDERREVILSRYRKAAQTEVVEKRRERGAKRSQRNLIYACAACLVATLILGGMLAPMGTVKSSALESPAAAVLSESVSREAALADLDAQIMAQSDRVQDHRKDLTVLIQQYGIPYFEGKSDSLAASEETMFRRSRQKLADFQTERDQIEGQIRSLVEKEGDDLVTYAAGLDVPENQVNEHFSKYREAIDEKKALIARGVAARHPDLIAAEERAEGAMKLARQETETLKSVTKTRLDLVNRQVERMSEMVSDRQDQTVDLALRAHTYTQAKESYEQSREMLREMKLARIHAGVGMERDVTSEPAVDKAEISEALASLNQAIPMSDDSDRNGVFNGSVSDLYALEADFENSKDLPLTWTAGVNLGFDDEGMTEAKQVAVTSKSIEGGLMDDAFSWSGDDGEGSGSDDLTKKSKPPTLPKPREMTLTIPPPRGSIVNSGEGKIESLKAQKRAASSASLSKAIAANSTVPTTIPVPKSEVTGPSMDFGEVDRFGDGWESGGEEAEPEAVRVRKIVTGEEQKQDSEGRPKGSYAFWVEPNNSKADIRRADSLRDDGRSIDRPELVDGGIVRESGLQVSEQVRRQASVIEADEALVEGRAAYAQGDYETAVAKYKEAAAILPAGTATTARKKVINDHLSDGAIALTQKYRRTGKYEEARKLLTEVGKNDPGSEILRKELDYLDDPIRTNPSLTHEHTKNVDKVRRNLYKGEGFYDLGLYDKADEEFKKIIKIDPYNKAARRWLERTDRIKSAYYRAHYDQTRAEMLMKVDREWELAVPPSKGDESGISENEEDLFDDFDEMTGLSVLPMSNVREGGGKKNLTGYLHSGNEGGQSSKGRASQFNTGSDTLFSDEIPLLELPEGFRGADLSHENLGERTITSKANQIIFPEVNFNNTTVEEALEFVRLRAIELDNTTFDESRKGVNLVLEDAALLERVLPKMKLENVPLSIVLEKIAEAVGTSVEFEDFAIRLSKGDKRKVFEGSDESDSNRKTHSKTNQIILPEIQIENASLAQALEFLRLRSKELDRMPIDNDGPKGVEIEVNDPELKKEILEGRKIGQLRLQNIPLKVAIEEVARMTGCKVRFDDGKVVFFSDPAKKVVDFPEGFETLTAKKSDSTFSLNVSDVSFKLAVAALREGRWPDASKVRPEEFVNALDYGDTKPSQAEKVACAIEQGAHPFMPQRNLMRVAMSTASLGRNASTPLRLTILLDQSGSMERADRAESVKRAFALLAAQLTANDEITLIGFARTPRLLAERVKGNEAAKLAEIIANPLTEGGTNLEAALSSGLQLAKQQFLDGAQNRIILLTDGAANLGDALPANLAKHVAAMRQANIAFDACGVGADGLNDEVLSALAKQGDGRYYFLDRPEDADAGFAKQIAGALRPSAKNVKVQILFNPERVSKFKLYGFEKHKLKKEDFRNDAVDAAEMAAEESGVALYHFEPLPEGRGDIGTVSVRFLDTASGQMVERTWGIPYEPEVSLFPEANPNLRLASVAGLFAEKLKGSIIGERVDLARLRQEAETLKSTFEHQPRFWSLKSMLQEAGQ